MGIQIVIDSTTDLSAQAAQRVKVVPLTIHFGDREYVSGVDMDARTFYETLVSSKALPTTSQPTPAAFADVFQKAVEAGDTVVCITISSKLSGTYQSASIAAEDFPGRVFVVDSQTVTLGCGILTEYALQLVDTGMEAQQLAETLQQQREKIHLLALLDTLEYLKKGGRISPTVAFAGGLLNIKPVICVEDGEVKLLGKARGSKQGNSLLVQQIEKAGGVDFTRPVMLGYTGLSDELLQRYMVDSAPLWQGKENQLPVSIIGSVVGTHAGPGAVAVAFFEAE